MSRALDDLDPTFKPIVFELLARFTEIGVPVMIIDTRRTLAEHQANLVKGVSWTKHSKHIDGLALDIAPYEMWAMNGPDKINWNAADPVWAKLGAIGESLGLIWGGRWVKKDLGHFEYVSKLSDLPHSI